MNGKTFFLWLGLLLSLCGCVKNDQQIRIDLKNEVRQEVKKRSLLIGMDLDSLCSLNRTNDLRHATDSIYKVRRAEIKKIATQ